MKLGIVRLRHKTSICPNAAEYHVDFNQRVMSCLKCFRCVFLVQFHVIFVKLWTVSGPLHIFGCLIEIEHLPRFRDTGSLDLFLLEPQ